MSVRGRVATTWEAALDVPYRVTARSAERLRARYPQASPGELIEIANRRFKKRVSSESALVGAVAAFPGTGTAVSAGASGAQLAAFVSEAAHHCLVVAHLYGIDMRDPAKRTALVLAALTGQEGAEAISLQVGIATAAWFRSSFINIRTVSADQFNRLMLSWLKRKAAKSAAMSTVGRLIPFGIGAAVGWGVGSALAKTTIEGVSLALGAPPLSFPAPRIVDVQVSGDEAASRAFEALRLPVGTEDEQTPARRWRRPTRIIDTVAHEAQR